MSAARQAADVVCVSPVSASAARTAGAASALSASRQRPPARANTLPPAACATAPTSEGTPLAIASAPASPCTPSSTVSASMACLTWRAG